MERIGIIGGGAWGTALAQTLARAGRIVMLWAHEPETVAGINEAHENALFLPGVTLDPALRATADLAQAAACDAVLLAVPAQHLRGVAARLMRSPMGGGHCHGVPLSYEAAQSAPAGGDGPQPRTLEMEDRFIDEAS